MYRQTRIVDICCILLLVTRLNVATNDSITSPRPNATFIPDLQEDTLPQETQSAQCTITAGDVQASAQATISKKLSGVCGSKQLAKSFEMLEARLLNELYQIRYTLNQIVTGAAGYPFLNQQQQHNGPIRPPFLPQQLTAPTDYMGMVPTPQPTLLPTPQVVTPEPTISRSTTTVPETLTTVDPKPAIQVKSIDKPTPNGISDSDSNYSDSDNEESDEYLSLVPSTTLKVPSITSSASTIRTPTVNENQPTRNLLFQPVQTRISNKSSLKNVLKKKKSLPRELEIAKFNNTVLSGDDIRIFSYYWRIDNFQTNLQSNISVIFSPVFSISGLHLKIKAVLNHLNRDYLYLQLESVPAENIIDDSNVVLESGTMFREIETKKLFRHKITILDQETPTSDLVSQEFLNTNSGFPVPNSAIISGPYAKDSSILIKVLIFI